MPTTTASADPIPACPRCHATHVVRNGKTRAGSPNFLCRGCDRRFVAEPKRAPSPRTARSWSAACCWSG